MSTPPAPLSIPAAVPATPAGAVIPEFEVSSLNELTGFVSDHTSFARPLWFRGVRDANHGLIPSLYRHPNIHDPEKLKDLEAELMAKFRHRAPPFVEQLPSEAFPLLFLMQHYGVPTRLLDWTENPYVAAFFAVENARLEDSATAPDAAIWVLDPLMLNATSLQNHTADRVLSIDDDLLHAYEPKMLFKNAAKLPIAVGGVHNSRRIVAQRGSFVLFGTNTHPMNTDATLSALPNLFFKLVIPGDMKQALRDSLFVTGFTDSVVYPDLDGLAREIRYHDRF